MPSLVRELVPFGLMTCCAVELNSDLLTVLSLLEALAWWISVMDMLMMLVSLVRNVSIYCIIRDIAIFQSTTTFIQPV